jgi:ribonuclease D
MLGVVGCSQSLADSIKEGKEGLRNDDWRQRPLPVPMLEYAAGDVRYLIPAFHKLMALLLEQGREKMREKEQTEGAEEATVAAVTAETTKEAEPPHAYADFTFSTLREERSRLVLAALARSQLICIEKSVRRVAATPQDKAREWAKDKLYLDFLKYKKTEARKNQHKPHSFTAWTPMSDAVFKRLYAWREEKAAAVDENPIYVVSVGKLLDQACALPNTPEALRSAVMAPLDLSPWMQEMQEEGLSAVATELHGVQEAAVQEHLARTGEEKTSMQNESSRGGNRRQPAPAVNNRPAAFYAMFDEALTKSITSITNDEALTSGTKEASLFQWQRDMNESAG